MVKANKGVPAWSKVLQENCELKGNIGCCLSTLINTVHSFNHIKINDLNLHQKIFNFNKKTMHINHLQTPNTQQQLPVSLLISGKSGFSRRSNMLILKPIKQ